MTVSHGLISHFPRGTLCALLRDGYSFDPRCEALWLHDWEEFDDFFYDNPHIADTCGLMTVVDGQPVGFVSWDPRQLPGRGIIGHNCVATAWKGRGFGREQMREAVRRIKARGAEKIVVTTNAAWTPARRMYESAGFVQVGEADSPDADWLREIFYEQICTDNQNKG